MGLPRILRASLLFACTFSFAAHAAPLTVVHSFTGADGEAPYARLIQGADGNFYGTTSTGGPNTCGNTTCGTVFKMAPGGAITTLHAFSGPDGSDPLAPLVQGKDGNLYGTTWLGGANDKGT